jgi:branched-chain amino acid transport system substrate-binding protein
MRRVLLIAPAAAVLAIMTATSPAAADVLIGDASALTGPISWAGEQHLVGTELAVADLNANGGLLGDQIRLISVDDACEPQQALAAAQKLIADQVVFVIGHICSGAAIATAPLYEAAGVIVISPSATNPTLTEEGRANVFRVVGRDDHQGIMAGNYLADRWGERKIAILHDGQAYGRGLAEEIRKTLNVRGVHEAIFEQITPGLVDYFEVVNKMQATNVDVLYYAGYPPEAGLLIRQLRDRGDDLQLVSADGLTSEDFWLIAGAAGEVLCSRRSATRARTPRRPDSSRERASTASCQPIGCSTATGRSRPGRRR